MNNFFEADAVESAPDYKTLISQGHATDGNPSLGVPATLPGAAWFDAVTQEIVNAIKAAGISPDTTKVNQLAEAIRSSASLSKAGIVQLSSAIDSLSETLAATPKAVKQAYDLATLALNIAQNFSAMPVGATIPYSGTVIPEGWLLCNWAEVSRTQFANLFSKIGTKWGAGDGETTFNVPDYNGRHVQGTTDISQVGVFLPAGLPNISGGIQAVFGNNGDAQGCFVGTPGTIGAEINSTGQVKYYARTNFNASLSNSIYGGSENVQTASNQNLIIIKF